MHPQIRQGSETGPVRKSLCSHGTPEREPEPGADLGSTRHEQFAPGCRLSARRVRGSPQRPPKMACRL